MFHLHHPNKIKCGSSILLLFVFAKTVTFCLVLESCFCFHQILVTAEGGYSSSSSGGGWSGGSSVSSSGGQYNSPSSSGGGTNPFRPFYYFWKNHQHDLNFFGLGSSGDDTNSTTCDDDETSSVQQGGDDYPNDDCTTARTLSLAEVVFLLITSFGAFVGCFHIYGGRKKDQWLSYIHEAEREVLLDAANYMTTTTTTTDEEGIHNNNGGGVHNNNNNIKIGNSLPETITYWAASTCDYDESDDNDDYSDEQTLPSTSHEGTLELSPPIVKYYDYNDQVLVRSIEGNGKTNNDTSQCFWIPRGEVSPSGKCCWVQAMPNTTEQILVTGKFILLVGSSSDGGGGGSAAGSASNNTTTGSASQNTDPSNAKNNNMDGTLIGFEGAWESNDGSTGKFARFVFTPKVYYKTPRSASVSSSSSSTSSSSSSSSYTATATATETETATAATAATETATVATETATAATAATETATAATETTSETANAPTPHYYYEKGEWHQQPTKMKR